MQEKREYYLEYLKKLESKLLINKFKNNSARNEFK